MSVFTHQHSLMFMFVSKANPIWEQIFGKGYSRATFDAFILDISTFNKWLKGKPIKPDTPAKVFQRAIYQIGERVKNDELAKNLVNTVSAFQDGFNSGRRTFDVHAGAKVLGITSSDLAYRAIDEAIYKRLPMFPGMLYDTHDVHRNNAATADFERYCGAWHIWIRRRDARGKSIFLRAAMRVRNLIPVGEGIGLRCKLNFPIINLPKQEDRFARVPRESWFSYDGFLAKREDHLSFTFEKRPDPTLDDQRIDSFQFMTMLGNADNFDIPTLKGTYLTLSQDTPREIISHELVMQCMAVDDDAAILSCMRSAAVLTSDTDLAYAESLFFDGKRSA